MKSNAALISTAVIFLICKPTMWQIGSWLAPTTLLSQIPTVQVVHPVSLQLGNWQAKTATSCTAFIRLTMKIPELLAVVKFNLNLLNLLQLILQLNLDPEMPILGHSLLVLELEQPILELEAVSSTDESSSPTTNPSPATNC